MNTNTQILIIDDSKLYREYLRKALGTTGIIADITESPDITSGIEQLKKRSFDCIVLDYILPDGNGLIVLEEKKILNITTPVVVLTGQGDEQIAVNLMKAGASDYISKSTISPELLCQCIKNAMNADRMEKQIKQSEEDLREATAQINHLLSSISSILIGTSSNDLINQWNLAAEKTFGISSGEAIGKHLSECGIKWEWLKVQNQLAICKAGNTSVQLENLHYTGTDGKDGLLSLHINPIEDTSGKQWGFVFLGMDITEQKKIQTQLMLSQKMESIGQLAAGIAHEINTPMQYIGDNTRFLNDSFRDILEVMKKYESLTQEEKNSESNLSLDELQDLAKEIDLGYLKEEIPKAIEQSLEGIDRVRKLILAMKEFSHPGKQGKSFSNINKAIEGTVIISRNEWKYVADLETELDPNLPMVYCAIDQINQVVLNMIVNSSQAIKELVDNGITAKGMIKIQTQFKDPYIRITISDTGKGIPRSIINKVFNHFFTTKEVGKGTGQGLSIAHDIIVNKHHGSIEVNSEEGKGAAFIVILPVNPNENDK
ncbi:MAG: two-component system sensor histidine kinase NtrB [Desulfitobacteriaceae bacterium]